MDINPSLILFFYYLNLVFWHQVRLSKIENMMLVNLQVLTTREAIAPLRLSSNPFDWIGFLNV